MAVPPAHHCRLIGSPWPGVYATEIVSGRHYARHTHATFGLGVVDDGAQRSASGRGTVDAYAGDIVATNPSEVHDGRPLGGPLRRWRTVYLEPQVLGEMEITRAAFRDVELQRALRRLLAGMERGDEALACEEALVEVVGMVRRRHGNRAGAGVARDAREPSLRVRQRLMQDMTETPTLAELAQLAGMSRFQLLRRFAAAHGLTPYAWLLQQRAERARALIRQGVSLGEAAAGAGFADQSHMTRTFSRQFGFTPGAWQRLQ